MLCCFRVESSNEKGEGTYVEENTDSANVPTDSLPKVVTAKRKDDAKSKKSKAASSKHVHVPNVRPATQGSSTQKQISKLNSNKTECPPIGQRQSQESSDRVDIRSQRSAKPLDQRNSRENFSKTTLQDEKLRDVSTNQLINVSGSGQSSEPKKTRINKGTEEKRAELKTTSTVMRSTKAGSEESQKASKNVSEEHFTINAMIPHHVVTFTGDTPSFNIKAVTDMIASIKAEEKSVFVISITGVFRSGKSFFINLMKVYLDYYTQNGGDAGWKDSTDMEIKGANWARGQNAVTHGIWMWMYPSLVHGKAILFMDCQGTGDNQLSSSTLDNLIVYIGLQLADVQVLNIKGQLASTDLDRLSLCALYADSASIGSIFEKLIFLIRDWEDEEPPQQLPEMLEEMTSATTKRSVNGILKAFSDVKTVGLCHPGVGVSRKSENDGVTIGNVDKEFLETAKKVFQELFGKMPNKTRNTGESLKQQFMMLSARAVDHVSSPLEVLGDSLVSKAFEEMKENYMKMLEKVMADGSTINGKDIAEVHEQAVKMFKDDMRVKEYADKEKQQEYIGHLEYMKGEVMSSVNYQVKLEKCDYKIAEQQEMMRKTQKEVDDVKDECQRLKNEIPAASTQESIRGKQEKLEKLEKEAKEKEEKEKQLFWQIDGLIQDKHKVVQEEAERHDKQTSYAIRWVLTKYVASRVAKIWEHQSTKL